jgi:hypothetical protein
VGLAAVLAAVDFNFSFHHLSIILMKKQYRKNPTRPQLSFQIRKLLLATLFVCGAFSLHAQTTWTGAASTDWATAPNWNTGAVPTATDDVSIPPGPVNKPVISTSAVAKSVEVQTDAFLDISSTGSLTINGSKNFFGSTFAFLNYGTVVSEGQLVIGNIATATVGQVGILNARTFTNKAGGSIQIDRTTDNAISNATTFDNSGSLIIGSLAATGGQGISNQGTFTNKAGGTIQIDRTSFIALVNRATFDNDGSITIGANASVGQNGIYNQNVNNNTATFKNTSTGEIRIDRSGSAIWNVSGMLQNDGKIILGSIASSGIGILSYAPFNNNTGAEIRIDRVGEGLVSTSTFDNEGLIEIGAIVPATRLGILNRFAGAVFNNKPGGDISIEQVGAFGITNEVNTVFINKSLIRIGTGGNIGGDGINNAGTFENTACATLTVVDNIANSSSFTNAGFFTVNTTQPHTNSGLTNDGVIAYPQGNPIPNVTNNDVIALPRASLCATFKPALMLSGSNSFTAAAIWYKDEALTMPAGNYNQATNEFTATNLAPGSSTQVYLSVTDDANACARIVSIPLTTATVTPGPNQSVVFGFGSNCTNISATATGAATLGYSWNNGAGNGATVNVCPQTTTTYTLTVTDGNTCQATGQVTVNVRDVRCGNQNQNVTICYYGVTQCVSEKIAARYLKLGATLGGCGTNARIGVEESSVPLQLSLKAYPNPVQDAVTVEVLAPAAGRGTFEVLDLAGRVRQARTEELEEGLNEVEFRLGSLPTGVYLIKATDAQNRQGVVRVSKE